MLKTEGLGIILNGYILVSFISMTTINTYIIVIYHYEHLGNTSVTNATHTAALTHIVATHYHFP